jgi:hypothetical protein
MAQSVVPKKEEKAMAIFEALGKDCLEQDFKAKFKADYPKAWQNIIKVYNDHETRDKKGKGHPMPEPEKYLTEMYKTYSKKAKSKS